ncbi:MAG: TIM barrel protein [Candidatus Woesearchaeota archaeon]
MVSFGSGANYYHPLDREYGPSVAKNNNESATGDVGVSIGDIGMSMGLGPIPNIPSIGAKLRGGTKIAELTFMGAHKGSAQGHTPEMYGELQRQALREMQKANEVNFTTHASVGVYGLAGMDQQGNFSKHSKSVAVDEIKRAIDFAADVARGGPVVVHTGEFQRPVSEASWNKDQKFKMFAGEEERASFRVVDTRTGAVIQEAKKNRAVSKPVWNTAESGTEYIDMDGKSKTAKGSKDDKGRLIYLDYWGKRIADEVRVPKFNKEKGEFYIHQMGWNDLIEESKQMTLRAQDSWEDWKKGKISEEEFKRSRWSRFVDAKSKDEVKILPEEAYIISTLETNAANSRGWATYYIGDFDNNVKEIKKLEESRAFFKKLEEETPKEEQWKLIRQLGDMVPGLVPQEGKLPTEMIDMVLLNHKRSMKQAQEGSSSQWAQAAEAEETIKHVESADTYAIKEAYDAYAEAGIQAMRRSQSLERQGIAKKPVFVAMENLFPESYGAHPDELIPLVKNSQKRMQQMLQEKYKMSEEEAKKRSQDHIGATFDTGHFNMWRKYWQSDPGKTMEDNDKDFNKWFLEKIEELAKSGVVKHLHIVDNYGYQDEHLAPGQGNTPIRDAIEIFKKNGFKGELIVEAGADYTTDSSGFQTMTKAWSYFGNPIYGASGGAAQKHWGDVQYGYFGHNQPPYFTFAPYSPSEDWTFWSGTPLE